MSRAVDRPAPRHQSVAAQSRPGRRKRRWQRSRLQGYALEMVRNGRIPAFLMGIGLSVVLSFFVYSEDFLVDTVVIRGNSIAWADSIVETSGAIGQSIFHVNTGDVAARVASHPAVASAEVNAELPDRVVVNLVEREPVMVWQSGQRAVLIDLYGAVLAESDDASLPRLIDFEGELPRPGDEIPGEYVGTLLFLWNEFGSSATFEYDDINGFTVHLPDNRSIRIGAADLIPVKMRVIAEVERQGIRWSRLDVRDPDRPVYQ